MCAMLVKVKKNILYRQRERENKMQKEHERISESL